LRVVGAIVLFLAGAIWSVPTGLAQTGGGEPPCMQCHRPSDVTIDPARYARSVHGAFPCTVCHTKGFNQFPHTSTRAEMRDCIDCHKGQSFPPFNFNTIAQAVKASVHVKTVDPAFRCENCHSPHYFIPASRITDASEFVFVSNNSCLACHAAGDTPAAKDLAFGKLAEKHRWLFHAELHLQRTACVACHTPPGQQSVHLILPKSEAVRDCTICHAKNSMLATKLYAHLALQERAQYGFVNAILFNNAYLTGANRNKWLDWGAFGLAGLVLLGVAAHGLGRWAFAGFRRRRS
jgi:Cytochrome c3